MTQERCLQHNRAERSSFVADTCVSGTTSARRETPSRPCSHCIRGHTEAASPRRSDTRGADGGNLGRCRDARTRGRCSLPHRPRCHAFGPCPRHAGIASTSEDAGLRPPARPDSLRRSLNVMGRATLRRARIDHVHTRDRLARTRALRPPGAARWTRSTADEHTRGMRTDPRRS